MQTEILLELLKCSFCRSYVKQWRSFINHKLQEQVLTAFINKIYTSIITKWPPLRFSGQGSWLENGDVLCFLWGTKWIYICYVDESRPPLWSSGQSSWLQNGDVLWFLWGTIWIYICYEDKSRPPLRSSGQSSWLQIQRSGFDSRRYHTFSEVVGWNGVHSASWVQLRSYLEERVAAPV
jgi:hypothetical protein